MKNKKVLLNTVGIIFMLCTGTVSAENGGSEQLSTNGYDSIVSSSLVSGGSSAPPWGRYVELLKKIIS
jgi:hypothetical protein